MKDYYAILKVKPEATQEEINKAYKKLVLKYHPDRHTKNKKYYEKKMSEINEAYSVLSDPVKRRMYDLSRQENVSDLDEEVLRTLFIEEERKPLKRKKTPVEKAYEAYEDDYETIMNWLEF